jgi:hydrogenase maturation protease
MTGPNVTRTGEAADLIEAWQGADDVIVVDAVVTGAPVGTAQAWDGRQLLPSVRTTASTHGFGVAEAIELARVLNRLPIRLQVYGIVGGRFEPGAQISPEVQRAVEEVVRSIIVDVSAASRYRSAPSSQLGVRLQVIMVLQSYVCCRARTQRSRSGVLLAISREFGKSLEWLLTGEE